MDVPAFCDTCGAVFRSGFSVVGDASNITLVGNTAGPCPVCSGLGHIPDGVFNFVGSTIEILSAPQRTRDELGRLAAILREAKQAKQSPEAVAEAIRTQVPGFSGVADLLPKTREELYAFLALVVSVVTLLLQGPSDEKSQNITVNQTINQVFMETDKSVNAAASKPRRTPVETAPKVGRNAPCPCGSGKKYKKCCGAVR